MFNELETPTVVLSTKYHKHLGTINNIDADSINATFNMNSAQEISFDVYKSLDGTECVLWDKIVDLKYIFVPEFQEYYEITISLDEDDKTVKHITGTSACETELSGRILRDFECNTETDIARDDYTPTVFYNSSKKSASLLHRVISDKCPDYSISHVDSSLANIQRTFSADDTDIYSFLTSTVAEEINCLFKFDSVNRTISAYDLLNVCADCGKRNESLDTCSDCSGTNLSHYGENTSVYISTENYAESISVECNTDDMYNCIKIKGGDDLITATVANISPNGSNYIYNYSSLMLNDMPSELVSKLESYSTKYDELKPTYKTYAEAYYQAIDDELKYQSEMMPTVTTPETTAKDELTNLLSEISEVAVQNISSLSNTSADLAVNNLAKVIVDSRYDVEVTSSTLSDLTSGTYRTWKGKFKITNKGDDDETAESTSNKSVKIVGNNYEEYLYQKIQKALGKTDATFSSIFEIDDLSTFKSELKKYCLDSLKSFEQSYQTCLDVLIENGVADKNSTFYDVDLYNSIYKPYYNRILAIQAEMITREKEVEAAQEDQKKYQKLMKAIKSELDLQSFIGDDLYIILSHYLKEDTYSNDNYISDGLSNSELIEKASELYEAGKTELNKSSVLTYTLTSSLNNLLNTEEFAPFKDKIALGNWITARANDELYRLRLIGIEIDYGSIDKINVTFSNATKLGNITDDLSSILSQSQSMAGSFNYVAHQANQGSTAKGNVDTWLNEGLNSALVRITNNDNEDTVIDNRGIICRSKDDILDDYSDEQLRITHNILAFTKDNWLTTSTALGKHRYTYYDEDLKDFVYGEGYGLSSEFVTSGYISGSQIVGGNIYSDNYSSTSGTYIGLRDGYLSFAGGKIVYDPVLNKMTMQGVNINWATTTTPEITDIKGLHGQLEGMELYLEQLDGKIQTYSQTDDPSLSWTTTTEKNNHKGDLWYNPSTNITQRWTGTEWEKITDSDLVLLAKSKAQIFTSQPVPPYYVGDLWVQGSSGDILNCIKTRKTGKYSTSDWTISSKYTDDSALLTWTNNYETNIAPMIKNQIDGKARSWYQSTDPSKSWDTSEDHEGDLWYDTSASSQVTYIYLNGAWEPTTVPKEVFDTIDGKASIYVDKPSNYNVSDLWILDIENSDGSDKTYPKYAKGTLLTAKKSNSGYSVSDWEEKVKYSSDLTEFINNTYSTEIEDIKAQSDKKADTYYQSSKPHAEKKNIAANTTYDAYVGDLWYNTSTSKVYRYNKAETSSGTYNYIWVEMDGVPDEVFDKIDGKKAIYTTLPTTYYENDIYILETDRSSWKQGSILVAVNDRTNQATFLKSDWTESVRYTDDSGLETFINGTYAKNLQSINTQIDKKAETWYQSTDPSKSWDTTALKNQHEGDLWYNTSADSHVTYIYQNGAWKATEVPAEFFDTVDGKSAIYVTVPDSNTALDDGDLLIPVADTGSYKKGKVYRYNTSTKKFVEIDYTDEATVQDIVDTATDEFNTKFTKILTGGYTTDIGDDYVISPHIGGGYLRIESSSNGSVIIDPKGIKTTSYIFGVYDSSGSLVMGVDKKGNGIFEGKITANSGSIAGLDITTSGLSYTTSDGLNMVKLRPVQSSTSSAVFYVGTKSSTNDSWSYPARINGDGSASFSNLTITGGSISINNTFKVTSKGVVTAEGSFLTGTSGDYATLNDCGVYFYNDSKKCVSLAVGYWKDQPTVSGVSLQSDATSKFISFGNKTSSSDTTYTTAFLLNYGLNPDGDTNKVIVSDNMSIYGGIHYKTTYNDTSYTLKTNAVYSANWGTIGLQIPYLYVNGQIRIGSGGASIRYIYYGSTVCTPSGTNKVIISATNCTNLGATGANSVFLCCNGDGGANGVHVESGTMDNGAWNVVFASSTTTKMRVNWILIIFNGDTNYVKEV
jgi:hypothetical protein